MGSKGSARERVVVLLICFGYLTLTSVLTVMSGERRFEYTDGTVTWALAVELVFGMAAAVLLVHRGWTASDFGFHVSIRSTLAALGLFVGTMLVCTAVYVAVSQSRLLDSWAPFAISLVASPALVLLFLVVNSIFEELFVVGYVIEAARTGDVGFAVSISAVIRLLYHTYQGPVALTSILPIGIIFALVYLRWRNLWPLMLAHTAINILSWVTN